MKTERVQSLINTIKDALICALQLHTADNIDESDVELHRRLINQVSLQLLHFVCFLALILYYGKCKSCNYINLKLLALLNAKR